MRPEECQRKEHENHSKLDEDQAGTVDPEIHSRIEGIWQVGEVLTGDDEPESEDGRPLHHTMHLIFFHQAKDGAGADTESHEGGPWKIGRNNFRQERGTCGAILVTCPEESGRQAER